jgi:hypothetical protein
MRKYNESFHLESNSASIRESYSILAKTTGLSTSNTKCSFEGKMKLSRTSFDKERTHISAEMRRKYKQSSFNYVSELSSNISDAEKSSVSCVLMSVRILGFA